MYLKTVPLRFVQLIVLLVFITVKFQSSFPPRHLLWTYSLKFVNVLSLNSEPLISAFWICLLNLMQIHLIGIYLSFYKTLLNFGLK